MHDRAAVRVGPKEGALEQEEAWCLLRGSSDGLADDVALLIDDPDHSNGEDRFLLLGLSAGLRILVVSHCCQKANREKGATS